MVVGWGLQCTLQCRLGCDCQTRAVPIMLRVSIGSGPMAPGSTTTAGVPNTPSPACTALCSRVSTHCWCRGVAPPGAECAPGWPWSTGTHTTLSSRCMRMVEPESDVIKDLQSCKCPCGCGCLHVGQPCPQSMLDVWGSRAPSQCCAGLQRRGTGVRSADVLRMPTYVVLAVLASVCVVTSI